MLCINWFCQHTILIIHNIEQEGIGYFVEANSPESWKAALDKRIVYTDRVEDKFEELSQTYNIENYAQEIYDVILILAKS